MNNRSVLVMATLCGALAAGVYYIARGTAPRSSLAQNTHLLEEVVQHIRQDYVDTLADSAIYRRAVDGALLELHDPHSTFLDPKRMATLAERTTGKYAGVGLQMDVRDSGIVIIGVLPGTPAEEIGIAVGDRILTIDGRTTRGLTSEEALRKLRGPAGSEVKVEIERAGDAALLPFKLVRRQIDVNPVRYSLMLGDHVGYVDLTIFSTEAAAGVMKAVDSLRVAGATSLVLDLRGDPGGLLDQGVDVADLFLDAGQKIVSTRGRMPGETQEISDRAPQRWPDMPIVVLTDSSSASASEIVAGALQDHDRAVIVGTATYGKGSAQRVFPVTGGAVKLTTALWYTPSGRSINRPRTGAGSSVTDSTKRPAFRTDAGRAMAGGGGIVPDVEVPQRVATIGEKAFQKALGTRVQKFRDALGEYALTFTMSHAIRDPSFTVTPSMRDELFRRMDTRGAGIPRAVFDSATGLVDRAIGSQVARYVFGTRAEFVRNLRADVTTTRAVSLVQGVKSQKELLARLPARTKE